LAQDLPNLAVHIFWLAVRCVKPPLPGSRNSYIADFGANNVLAPLALNMGVAGGRPKQSRNFRWHKIVASNP